jgi:hypothetical protein
MPTHGSTLEADAMTANKGDHVRHIPADRPEFVPDAKIEDDHGDMAARKDPTRAEWTKPRKLVTQGRPRETLKRRFT